MRTNSKNECKEIAKRSVRMCFRQFGPRTYSPPVLRFVACVAALLYSHSVVAQVAPGDSDDDCKIDLRDVANWQSCFGVSDIANALCTDLTGDFRIPFDLAFFQDFQPLMTGPAEAFPNGVASGDIDQSSVVLWARTSQPGIVRFEYGRDPDFDQLLDGFVDVEVTNPKIPAKVDVGGLLDGTQYYFRACRDTCPSALSTDCEARGSFRTPFASGKHGLSFGVSSCWRGDMKPFVSMRNVPDRDLDFFVALGDTVYADSKLSCGTQAKNVHVFRCNHELAYSKLKSRHDNFFALARASTSVFVDTDDHEIDDNFSGGGSPTSHVDNTFCDPNSDPPDKNCDLPYVNETDVFKDGMKAWHEYNPIREELYGNTGDRRTANKTKVYRYRTFGKDAAILMLDTRTFRDEPLELVDQPYVTLPVQAYDSSRTMLGSVQLNDLKTDLLDAQQKEITWKFVMVPEPIQNIGAFAAADRFEGYAYERGVILDFIETQCIDNVVFISGDIHSTFVNNLAYERSALDLQRYSSSWDISTGPAAYDPPIGAVIPDKLGGISEDAFNLLPREGKDLFVETALNELLLLQNYPPLGLGFEITPLPILQPWNKSIPATLLQGLYTSSQTFGWTEFEIDAVTQKLLVTTYGIDWYARNEGGFTDAELNLIMAKSPIIVSQFEVSPACGCEPIACINDAGCCPNAICNALSCVWQNSLENLEVCTRDDACESGICLIGFCGGCQPIGDACLEIDDCCGDAVCSTLLCVGRNSLPALAPCTSDDACRSGNCVAGFCEQACGDGRCDGTEACGDAHTPLECQADCGLCTNGSLCFEDGDCQSGNCILGFCANCQETGDPCLEDDDCCSDDVCSTLLCVGRNSLPALAPCTRDVACRSGSCVAGFCEQGCGDGACDGTETCGDGHSLIECQADCGLCPNGTICFENGDCQSGNCIVGICANCQETGDPCLEDPDCCGDNVCSTLLCVGPNSLPALAPCTTDAACRSGNCVGGVCAQVCGDGYCDGLEACGSGNSGVECRSDCGRCPNGSICFSGDDCQNYCCAGFCRGCKCVGFSCSSGGQCCSGRCFLSVCSP